MIGNAFLGSALLTGAAFGLWSQIKVLGRRALSVAFVSAVVEGQAAQAVQSLCWAEFRRSPFGDRRYGSGYEYVRPLKRLQLIALERVGIDPVVYWDGWRPIVVSVKRSDSGGGSAGGGPGGLNDSVIAVTSVRGAVDVEAVILRAVDRMNRRREDTRWADSDRANANRFRIVRVSGNAGRLQMEQNPEPGSRKPTPGYVEASIDNSRLIRWSIADIGPEVNAGRPAVDSLALCDAALSLVREAKQWVESEPWYRERQIPWTRGAQLYGPPGTGKTSLVRAIAQDLNLPVYAFDLASMTNRDMVTAWDDVRGNAPCVALFEDIDAVFHGRANVATPDGGLTFDCLLNVLGGIDAADGVFKVATTNDPSKVDPALGVAGTDGISTRPGRFDVAVELGPLDARLRRKLADRICVGYPEEVDRLVSAGDGDSGARFVERCRRVAIDRYWAMAHAIEAGDPLAGRLAHVGKVLLTVAEARYYTTPTPTPLCYWKVTPAGDVLYRHAGRVSVRGQSYEPDWVPTTYAGEEEMLTRLTSAPNPGVIRCSGGEAEPAPGYPLISEGERMMRTAAVECAATIPAVDDAPGNRHIALVDGRVTTINPRPLAEVLEAARG